MLQWIWEDVHIGDSTGERIEWQIQNTKRRCWIENWIDRHIPAQVVGTKIPEQFPRTCYKFDNLSILKAIQLVTNYIANIIFWNVEVFNAHNGQCKK